MTATRLGQGRRSSRWRPAVAVARRVIAPMVLAAVVAGCGTASSSAGPGPQPATMSKAANGQTLIRLTPAAAKRLDIQTAPVQESTVPARLTAATARAALPTAALVSVVRPDPSDSGAARTPVGGGGTGAGGGAAPAPDFTPVAPTTTAPPAMRQTVPYSAVLYQPSGEAFTYVNTAPLTYARQALTIDYVTGDAAVLVNGPADGTLVVTVGGTELLGIEQRLGQ